MPDGRSLQLCPVLGAGRGQARDAASTAGGASPGGGASIADGASMAGGPAPVRAYIEELLPDVLEGRIEPGRVFDRTGSIEDVPDGYRAMNDREVLKFQIKP